MIMVRNLGRYSNFSRIIQRLNLFTIMNTFVKLTKLFVLLIAFLFLALRKNHVGYTPV